LRSWPDRDDLDRKEKEKVYRSEHDYDYENESVEIRKESDEVLWREKEEWKRRW